MKTPIIDLRSESEVLRASTILLLQLHDVRFGQWAKEEKGDLMVRAVAMQVVIDDILKGKIRQNAGESIGLTVKQRGTGGLRVMDYYGLWSHVPLADGVRLIAFCHGASDDASVLLTDDNCEQLLDPAVVLADTKAALELETRNLSTAEILAQADKQADKRSALFARYILAKTKLKTMALSDTAKALSDTVRAFSVPSHETFEALMKILEDPKTTEQARASYLTSIYEELGLMESPPRQLEVRLIQAMFRLLVLPEAKLIQANVGEVYLPNLLGLTKEFPRHSATEVFKDRSDDRLMILSALKHEQQSDSMKKLINWLEREDR